MMGARTALSVALIVALAGAISPSVAAGQSPGPAPMLRGRELVEALRGGGYVVYFRHATTDSSQADTDRENLERCDTHAMLERWIPDAVAAGAGLERA
jgi:hypothetical protein